MDEAVDGHTLASGRFDTHISELLNWSVDERLNLDQRNEAKRLAGIMTKIQIHKARQARNTADPFNKDALPIFADRS